eukprot:gb/GECG01014685.1/.p1 GENE.gb/GECG01014685.1/~~gb/GECG01014685.1/.p1  ORF type:complete len:135 (+),score=11.64 gb/GECG01014685.1/:1-405(+)
MSARTRGSNISSRGNRTLIDAFEPRVESSACFRHLEDGVVFGRGRASSQTPYSSIQSNAPYTPEAAHIHWHDDYGSPQGYSEVCNRQSAGVVSTSQVAVCVFADYIWILLRSNSSRIFTKPRWKMRSCVPPKET